MKSVLPSGLVAGPCRRMLEEERRAPHVVLIAALLSRGRPHFGPKRVAYGNQRR